MFDIKSFYKAKDMADTINALVRGPDAEIISGDTDILIHAREGKDVGRSVVSIHNMEALRGVRPLDNGGLWIGAGTVFPYITNDTLVQKHIPMLGDAVDMVGGPQIRNTGTIGGSTYNGATSANSTSTMWTLEADVLSKGLGGKRTVLVCEFYTGPGRIVRQRTGVCTGFLTYKSSIEGWSGYYIKYGERKAAEIVTLGCAVCVKLSRGREWTEDVRLEYGVAGPAPLCCRETRHGLKGHMVNDKEAILAFGKATLEEMNPRSLWRVSKKLRLQLIEELPKRASAETIKRAGGVVSA